MDLFFIILFSILMFSIIYFAVRLAIQPLLLLQQKEETLEQQDFGLVKLRDINILNNDELEEIIELYNKKFVKKDEYEAYQKYANVLSELKELGYFTNEDYLDKMAKLKNYFKIG